MSCETVRPILDAFVDNELDAMNSASVEAHLAVCAKCAAQHESLLALRSQISRQPAFSLSGAQRQRMLSPLPQKPKANRGWFGGFGLGLATMAAVWFVFAISIRNEDPRIDQLLGSHLRSLMPGHTLDVVSTDRHTVKPWFDGKVSIAPKVFDLKADGFPLIGGRLDLLDGRPTPALVFGHGPHVINVFVFAKGREVGPTSRDGYQMLSWATDDLEYVAVSDTDRAELERFESLYRSAR